MTQVVKGTHAFSCDGCPEAHEGEPGEAFGDVWAAARAAGWVAFVMDGGWHHRCPVCAEET